MQALNPNKSFTNSVSSPCRVLHISVSNTGGGPEHVYQLLRALPGQGIQALVAAPPQKPCGPRLAALAGPGAYLPMPLRRFSPAALLRLAAFARAVGVHLIHSHGKGAGLYGRLASLLTGIPCVHTFHGLHLAYGPWGQRAYLLLERLLGMVTAGVIAVSPGEARLITDFGLCPPDRLSVIPNGVTVPQTVTPPQPGAMFRVIHVSRFDPAQKNSAAVLDVALALQAMGAASRVKFVMIGQGPGLAPLQEAVAAAGCAGQFQFTGQLDDPRPLMRGAGCLLSTSRWEGLPLAVLEAMAEGVPAVVTDVVGNRDAVDHGITGWRYPLGDPAAAARHIAALQADPQLRLRLGEQAHAAATVRFDLARQVRDTANLYRRLVTSCRRPVWRPFQRNDHTG